MCQYSKNFLKITLNMPYEKETAAKRDNHGSFGGGGRK
jgi:uncharacterized membrane protein